MGLARVGVGILGQALKNLGKFKGATRAVGNTWGNLTHGLRPVANNTVTAIVPYAGKAAPAAAKMTRGVLHPLSMLATGAKVAAPVATIGTAVAVGKGAYDLTDPTRIGEGKVGDLGSKGSKFKDDYSLLDQVRLRAGGLLRGDVGSVFTGPDADTQRAVLEAAKGVRNDDYHNQLGGRITSNQANLGGLKAGVTEGQDFTGMTQQQILAKIQEDELRVQGVANLQNIERGAETLATLSPNASSGDLRGALTSTHVENRTIAEKKLEDKEKAARRREDDNLRIERERADANTRLQLILGNQTVRRQEEADERARNDRMYYDNLDRQERRSQRRATRIRDERQAQREMIGMLLGGLDNLGS